ncbi:uncharacterized protein H6S33_008944 [Morchella sextelata]|uniref:uncharacterized protein n=1 Tax=Morchella sextelata TaxID=1174677 RepID=UPI001D040078|nr:uncharacterized protein H6S33_008944 [Morchella sextelata]KAH0612564.1 hypothetical protein H6S33_008944 [Morchella sextelata]
MVLEALGQSSRNEVDLESKPRLQENINRPPKRIKHVHLHKSTNNNNKGKIGKKSESEREQEDSPSFGDIVPAEFGDDLDNGLYASLPLPNDHDTAIREYTTTERYRKSIYVDAFNLALDTVLKDELHLFSDSEQEIFAKYRSLEYEPQFLYVRLFLRKTSAWFRVRKLGYYNDISDMVSACKTLQCDEVGFAENEKAITTLEEAVTLLNMEELKLIAKEAKATGSNKVELMAALKNASGGQVGLGSKGQLGLSFDKKGNYVTRDTHFVKKILEMTGPLIRLKSSATTLFERIHLVFYRSSEWTEKSLTTMILARTQRRNFPDYIVSRTSNIFPTRASLLDFEESIKIQSSVDEILENNGAATMEGLETVRTILDGIYEKWKRLMAEDQERKHGNEEEELEKVYLRRFSAAWVLTRVVHKGEYVLGRLKDYAREYEVLNALLAQRGHHPARKGGWYQRRALIEENYMASITPGPTSNTTPEANKKIWLRKALKTCEAGLQDPETHLIYHYDLQKRIMKLEPRLRIPKKDQHDFGHSRLIQPETKTIMGERIFQEIVANDSAMGRKTIWRDEKEGGECSVEEMCLSYYRSEGWKGYHSEGGILKTLFAYLFYDIMFLYLPNVFQTQFQTCPLDLFTDGFYPARLSEINHRLAELSNGGAATIIENIDRDHRCRRTCIIGLDWSFAKEDLLEIVDCIGGDALGTICKVFCQEYRQRASGLPDLFLWNHKKKLCMFSEVKSENDRLSDKQRLWIHVLSGAGVKVELCAAVARQK